MAAAQLPGSVADDRARLGEITGRPDSVRAPRSLTEWLPPLRLIPGVDRLPLYVVEPDVRLVHNSSIPFSPHDDGALWAGRGVNVAASGGVGYARSVGGVTIRAQLAPLVVYSENAPFPMLPPVDTTLSAFASPFHPSFAIPMDVPVRFGDLYVVRLDPGRSLLELSGGAVAAGITARDQSWGPAIRNPLVLSANAAGIPRLYLRTARPVRTRAGIVSAELFGGTLTESRFFDREPANDYRALSAATISLRPAFDSTLTLGIARAVYSATGSPVAGPLTHILRSLTRWEYVARPGDTTATGAVRQRSDQVLSLFARWVFPASGFEVYGEWARMDFPRTVTELLVASHHSAGYTIGFQLAQPQGGGQLRLQAEVTYLEQSAVFDDRPPRDFYAGRVSAHGFTNRGQVVGAGIGPGGSSQFVALDHLARRWQGGVFVGRIRWENDALYRQPAPNFFRHDVTVFGGVRGGWRAPVTDLQAEATMGYRYNYMFQYGGANPGGFRTVDIRNLTLALRATPR